MNRGNLIRVLVAIVALAVCAPSAGADKDVSWIFDLSGKGGFLDLPFPTELRRKPNGKLSMSGFPNPYRIKTVERTKKAMAGGYGYSTAPVIYFKFDGALDPDSLPGPEETMRIGADIFLIDVDPNSPEKGRRFPLMAHFYKKAAYMNSARNLLAFQPVPGFVLRENTLYAAGVMTSLPTAGGGGLKPSLDLQAIANMRTPEGKMGWDAQQVYIFPMLALMTMDVDVDQLAALTTFWTGDPTERMQRLYAGVIQIDEFEFEEPLEQTRDYDLYTVLEGKALMPQYQDGKRPYDNGKGGRIQFDDDGEPVVQRWESVAVALSIPKGKAPKSGFPIMIYIHGTAGVSTQFIDRGEIVEEGKSRDRGAVSELVWEMNNHAPEGTGPAMIYAQHGIAGAGAAQQHAGERGGSSTQLGYYNFFSPEALRDNMLQATAEAAFLLRLIKQLEIDPALCPDTDAGGGPVRFNPELIFGTGQSLGSLILGPWGAVETDLKALIPAGNGAYWSLFIAEGNALDTKLIKRRGGGQGDLFKLDRFHPFVSILSNVLAEADPFAYQPHYFKRPLPGRAPKHVWAPFGLYDHYFYPVSQNAAILAMGLDVAGSALEDSTEEMLDLAGLKQLDYPIRQNRQTPAGPVTAVAVQFEQYGPLDGHHVTYQRDDAKQQYGCFLESLVRDGVPTVREPGEEWDDPCGK